MDGKDGRRRRSAATAQSIRTAVSRLVAGKGTHPLHLGIKVRITKVAIAREARVGYATLFRYPSLLEGLTLDEVPQRISVSEAQRKRLVDELTELKRQHEKLFQENTRLTHELAACRQTLARSTKAATR